MSPFRAAKGGCIVSVRVTPRSRLPGIAIEGDRVRIRVRAAPEAGRATAEAAALLAGALGAHASAVRLKAGPTSRTKAFEVSGLGPHQAAERLAAAS